MIAMRSNSIAKVKDGGWDCFPATGSGQGHVGRKKDMGMPKLRSRLVLIGIRMHTHLREVEFAERVEKDVKVGSMQMMVC
jgi:hypothetical protein